jgi:hypothetical protein
MNTEVFVKLENTVNDIYKMFHYDYGDETGVE